ncbi:HlyD family secretion protein [Paroceanicella profunda]|uniref:HlyD family secretion protein n=1 Tax=Paroceanicella profunda TaxID=2579971 RepID=A0A5B8FIM3_9RHOB|nr:HlyD family secretion protein [Paroceanicella profunda]QDL93417.1 HlyD family secretion protein [Paroceanicella profunda]
MARDYESEKGPQDRQEAPGARPPAQGTETVATGTAGGAEQAKPPKGGRRRIVLFAILAAAIAAGAWYGYQYWTVGRFLEETDDAYVQADYSILSPRITGYVARVPVVDNQAVKAGDPLVEMDDGDYRIALRQAEAQIAAQRASVDRITQQVEAARVGIDQADAELESARASADFARIDYDRYANLATTKAASVQQKQEAETSLATARAGVKAAEAGVASAKANLAVVKAQKTEAEASLAGLEAQRDQAQRDLDATVLRAPFDGVVGNSSVVAGDYISPGRRLMAVVPLGAIYIEANFKETQIGKLTPGTPVDITVDAFPDRHVTGHVQGLSPASGAVFSMLPPENATGNFTKVVQRLPVRITVPQDVADAGWLRPGLSVVVTADTRRAP